MFINGEVQRQESRLFIYVLSLRGMQRSHLTLANIALVLSILNLTSPEFCQYISSATDEESFFDRCPYHVSSSVKLHSVHMVTNSTIFHLRYHGNREPCSPGLRSRFATKIFGGIQYCGMTSISCIVWIN